jgi:hypothetical protein
MSIDVEIKTLEASRPGAWGGRVLGFWDGKLVGLLG